MTQIDPCLPKYIIPDAKWKRLIIITNCQFELSKREYEKYLEKECQLIKWGENLHFIFHKMLKSPLKKHLSNNECIDICLHSQTSIISSIRWCMHHGPPHWWIYPLLEYYPSNLKNLTVTVYSQPTQNNFLLTYSVKIFKKFLKEIPNGVSFSGRGAITYASPCKIDKTGSSYGCRSI